MARVDSDTGAFAIVPEWLLDIVSDRAVRLYAILCRYADSSGHAFPSRSTLAERLGCSRDTIDRALRELVSAKALAVEHQRDAAGDPTVNRYTVLRLRGSRTGAARSPQDSGHGSRTGAAQNESHLTRVAPPTPPTVFSAIDLMAGRELEAEKAKGKVRSEQKWLEAKTNRLLIRYGKSMTELARNDPDLTPDKLVSLVLNAPYRHAYESSRREAESA